MAKKPAHRGEREVSRKAIAQGMSECFRCPVCSCAPNAQFRHTRPRVQRAPGIPCALWFERGKRIERLGRNAPRECEAMTGIVSRAPRSMKRLRNDALQTRDPGVWGRRDGSRLCGAPPKKRCTASGTREGGRGSSSRSQSRSHPGKPPGIMSEIVTSPRPRAAARVPDNGFTFGQVCPS